MVVVGRENGTPSGRSRRNTKELSKRSQSAAPAVDQPRRFTMEESQREALKLV